MGKSMCTKLSVTKTRILRVVVCFLLTLNAHAFDTETFSAINTFFKKVNSNLEFTQEDIRLFDQNKTLSSFVTHKNQIQLPYFIFKSEKPTDEYVLYVGGIHADEFAPLYFSLQYLMEILNNPSNFNFQKNIIFIPLLDIDGFLSGIKKRDYPFRHNGEGIDLNRSFYAFDQLPNYQSTPENELVIHLIKKYAPKFWVIPHSSINILDFDGKKDEIATKWLDDVFQATTARGGEAIPIKDFRDYAPPRSKTNWSIGKLANHLDNVYSLTYEFSGPGEYPAPNDPNRYEIITRRKQLGRFEDTAWIAELYFNHYLHSMNVALFIEDQF